MNIHKRYLIAIVALMIISLPQLSNAQRMFGGIVESMTVCDDGLLLYVLEPLNGMQQYMWEYGELPFLMYVPPHIGQYLLGDASLFPSTCWIGDVYEGYGFPILFHGESI